MPTGHNHDAQDAAWPRGGMILTNDPDIGRKINSAVFPGLQGGPLMHVIAAKAVAFGEALRPEFRGHQKAVVENARVLAETLMQQGSTLSPGARLPSDAGRFRRSTSPARPLRPAWRGPASLPTRTPSRSIRRSPP